MVGWNHGGDGGEIVPLVPIFPPAKMFQGEENKGEERDERLSISQIPAEGEVEAAAASAAAAVTKQVKREESIAKGAHWRLLKNRRVVSGRWR
jgi:hypothetical protein